MSLLYNQLTIQFVLGVSNINAKEKWRSWKENIVSSWVAVIEIIIVVFRKD